MGMAKIIESTIKRSLCVTSESGCALEPKGMSIGRLEPNKSTQTKLSGPE
jgi:hypothetical protein